MRCKICGGRKFNIIVKAVQTFWTNENDEWEDSDLDILDEIEGEGTYCNKCDRVVEVIMEKREMKNE